MDVGFNDGRFFAKSITPSGAADRAGIHEGDILLKFKVHTVGPDLIGWTDHTIYILNELPSLFVTTLRVKTTLPLTQVQNDRKRFILNRRFEQHAKMSPSTDGATLRAIEKKIVRWDKDTILRSEMCEGTDDADAVDDSDDDSDDSDYVNGGDSEDEDPDDSEGDDSDDSEGEDPDDSNDGEGDDSDDGSNDSEDEDPDDANEHDSDESEASVAGKSPVCDHTEEEKSMCNPDDSGTQQVAKKRKLR